MGNLYIDRTNETYNCEKVSWEQKGEVSQMIPDWCRDNKRVLAFPYHYATKVKRVVSADGTVKYGFNVYWFDWYNKKPEASPRFGFKTRKEATVKRQDYVTWEILMDQVKMREPYTLGD